MEQRKNVSVLTTISLHALQLQALILEGVITPAELEQVPRELMIQSLMRDVHSDPCIVQIIKDKREAVA